MDSNGRPIPVMSVDDDPPGFPFTCTSEAELRQLFPGAEFVFLTPKANNTSILYDPEIEKQALAMMGKEKVPTPPTQAQRDVKLTTVGIAAESQRIIEQTALGPRGRAEEFLKRLQTALQYASKKHEKKLKDQVEIIEELIREVF
ncbi:hypothetical protein EBZ38_03385 [bacterium]|nr:hypothetical protein [bacterium]NDD83310.1 hypothetical protein [bacterium]